MRITTRHILAALAVACLLAACAGESTSTQTTSAPLGSSSTTPTPTPTASPTPAGVSLRDTCPEVEQAMKKVDPLLDGPGAVESASHEVANLAAAGDTETKNALDGLAQALAENADASPGQEAVDAARSYLDALDNLATRCAAVGSTALQ
jgi:hypothetical protein